MLGSELGNEFLVPWGSSDYRLDCGLVAKCVCVHHEISCNDIVL